MIVSPSISDTCPDCGWKNLVLRSKCRNCGAVLRQHPDPAIDREVRLDAEDGRRYEENAGKSGGSVKDYPDGIHTDCEGVSGGLAIETFPAPEGGYHWRVMSLATWSRRRDAEEAARQAARKLEVGRER